MEKPNVTQKTPGEHKSTDRELLELAAKAAGYMINAKRQAERDATMDPARANLWIPGHSTAWNPLNNDGEALRLAVTCKISFGFASDTGRMRVVWFMGGMLHALDMPEDHPTALPTSTVQWLRRAIVQAAAEIARYAVRGSA